MKKQSYFFLGMAIQAFIVASFQAVQMIKVTPAQEGMAIQAFIVAFLQAVQMIKVTPAQQGMVGIFFLGVMAVTIITGKR